MSAVPHPFDEAIALQAGAPVRGRTHPGYANMIGPYGGITAAQVLAAVMRDERRLGDPVALTVNYAAALADGEFEVQAEPLRTNRSTQHWLVLLRQAGQVVVSATAVTALRRDTWGLDDEPMPAVPPPQDVPPPTAPKVVAWLHRYQVRFVHGPLADAWDGRDHGDSQTTVWMRDDPPRPLDHCSLAALCDVFYPRNWRRRALRVPSGTVSMTVYFHASADELAATGSGWVLGRARAQALRRGYFDQTAVLWNQAGLALASTHQIVYYKE